MSELILPGSQTREALDHQALADRDAERGTRRNKKLLQKRVFRTTPAARLTGLLPLV